MTFPFPSLFNHFVVSSPSFFSHLISSSLFLSYLLSSLPFPCLLFSFIINSSLSSPSYLYPVHPNSSFTSPPLSSHPFSYLSTPPLSTAPCQVYKFDMNMRPVAQNGSELPLSGEFLEKKVLCSPLLYIPFFASHYFFA